jgi:hypothetical protein
MEFGYLLLLICAGVYCFCTGASWMLQFVCYPTYKLVGSAEFVPFHIAFGRRLLIVIGPMVLVALATLLLVFLRPVSVPLWASLVVAACSLIILVTTIALEVPKHMQLDKEGKSDAVLEGLVRDNIPRTISWTVGSVLLIYMVSAAFLPA